MGHASFFSKSPTSLSNSSSCAQPRGDGDLDESADDGGDWTRTFLLRPRPDDGGRDVWRIECGRGGSDESKMEAAVAGLRGGAVAAGAGAAARDLRNGFVDETGPRPAMVKYVEGRQSRPRKQFSCPE
jgi:hypothetical protein